MQLRVFYPPEVLDLCHSYSFFLILWVCPHVIYVVNWKRSLCESIHFERTGSLTWFLKSQEGRKDLERIKDLVLHGWMNIMFCWQNTSLMIRWCLTSWYKWLFWLFADVLRICFMFVLHTRMLRLGGNTSSLNLFREQGNMFHSSRQKYTWTQRTHKLSVRLCEGLTASGRENMIKCSLIQLDNFHW